MLVRDRGLLYTSKKQPHTDCYPFAVREYASSISFSFFLGGEEAFSFLLLPTLNYFSLVFAGKLLHDYHICGRLFFALSRCPPWRDTSYKLGSFCCLVRRNPSFPLFTVFPLFLVFFSKPPSWDVLNKSGGRTDSLS